MRLGPDPTRVVYTKSPGSVLRHLRVGESVRLRRVGIRVPGLRPETWGATRPGTETYRGEPLGLGGYFPEVISRTTPLCRPMSTGGRTLVRVGVQDLVVHPGRTGRRGHTGVSKPGGRGSRPYENRVYGRTDRASRRRLGSRERYPRRSGPWVGSRGVE